MSAWRSRVDGPLIVTRHGTTEIVNAICRMTFIGALKPAGMHEALAELKEDLAQGRLRHADILWRAALNRASELSETYTPRLGTRSLDVLHVACALELKSSHFLTFDERQRKLASATGLKIIRLQ
jgi:predicted nucleic acid-binding protein